MIILILLSIIGGFVLHNVLNKPKKIVFVDPKKPSQADRKKNAWSPNGITLIYCARTNTPKPRTQSK
jgi:hypothetical protein